MSIKFKLFFAALIYSIFFILVMWFENITLKNFNNLKNTKESIKELHIAMLTLRRNEKDFLLRQNLRYVDRFKQNANSLNEKTYDLKKYLQLNKIDTKKLEEFRKYIKEYRKYFLVLVEQYKLNGLDASSGLTKKFNDAIDQLDKQNRVYHTIIMDLRLSEKNFLITNQLSHIEAFEAEYKKVLELLPKTIHLLLEEYRHSFLQVVDGMLLLGLDENSGIRGEMRSNVHKTEVILDTMIMESEAIINEKIESIEFNRAIIVFVLILATLFFLFNFFNNISNAILGLKNGLDNFFKYLNHQSDERQLLEVNSNDEIGKMAKSINENILNTSKRLEDERQRFEKELALKTKELKELNENLEFRVKEEVEKNTQKQIQLFAQSKMASLGSMIGNIIHQWRQPLTQISMLASVVKLQVTIKNLDNEKLEKDMDTIIGRVEYMNQVLVTFRNYVMEKKEKKEVILQDRIDRSLKIVELSLKDQYIELKKSIDYGKPIKINLVIGELSEVIINIINNAKDALIDNKIKEPWISIGLIEEKNKAIISIEDNGGGVPKDALAHIFEENFTTKDESVGTGLGLFMSHEIITKSFGGKLYCENTDNGARFYIELPLNKD